MIALRVRQGSSIPSIHIYFSRTQSLGHSVGRREMGTGKVFCLRIRGQQVWRATFLPQTVTQSKALGVTVLYGSGAVACASQAEYDSVLASLALPLPKGSMKQARESGTPGAQWVQVQMQTLFLTCMALGKCFLFWKKVIISRSRHTLYS